MIVKHQFSAYNARRCGRPWGAVVTLKNGKPEYNFSGSHFWGCADKGGFVAIEASEGQIVAFGQKDNRVRQDSVCQWFLLKDNKMCPIEQADALIFLHSSTETFVSQFGESVETHDFIPDDLRDT